MIRILFNFIRRFDLHEKLWIHPNQAYSTTAKEKVISKMKIKFFPEENRILKVANESNKSELEKYVYPSIAKKIIAQRNTNGPYKSLDDLFVIDGFKNNAIYTFCTSIIANNSGKQSNRYTVTPDIQMNEIPKTVLGIHVGPTLISWLLINHNFEVLDWNFKHWYDTKLNNSHSLITLVPSVVERIPAASVYIMEDAQLIRNSIAKNIMHIQQQLSVSIMSYLSLRDRKNQIASPLNNIFILHPNTTARHFNLLLGSEVVAAEYVVKINNTNCTLKMNSTESMNLYLNYDILDRYMEGNSEEQEQMRWSLLKSITFLRLIAIRNNFKEVWKGKQNEETIKN
ncbi:uncharacterized protein LOC128895353 isoform X1 [Hylaeus anthracinus]|uniref:uncharacterized protein LOC128895353 isoform X1 n=1 Tax=Hylaeus anthracinus TaxID=313031 RepID=UPI0023B9D371|nr:uncharacterized protein LOC128895353 isoform X1 [Hylaeus anthracinus]